MSKDQSKERRVSSVAVFNKEGKLLFGKRRDCGKYTMPGGHCEGDEAPEKAALREMIEETGLVPEELTFLGEGLAGRKGNVRIFSYRAIGRGTPTARHDPDHEFSEFRWVGVKNGLPPEIENHLYNPKDVTLRLLGLQEGQVNKSERDDWVAFHPHQIKSALGNNGNFDPFENDITKDELAKMAIADIQPGKKEDNTGLISPPNYIRTMASRGSSIANFNYDHVLKPEHLKDHYAVRVMYPQNRNPHGTQNMNAYLFHHGTHVGEVTGRVNMYPTHLQVDLAHLNEGHRGKELGVSLYEALYAHAKHNFNAHEVYGSTHSTPAHIAHRKLAARHGLNYKAEVMPGMEANKIGEYDDRYSGYHYQIKSEEDEPIDGSHFEGDGEVDRLIKHPNPAERSMALKLDGVRPDHISTALRDSHADVRLAALNHPLFDTHHVDEVFTSGDNNLKEMVLPSPHVRTEHLDQAWASGDERLRDIVAEHPKLTDGHILKFYHEPIDDARKIQLLSHPNITPDVVNKIVGEGIEHVNHGGTNYPVLHALSSPALAMEHLLNALHSPDPRLHLSAIRNPLVPREELERLLVEDSTSRQMRQLALEHPNLEAVNG